MGGKHNQAQRTKNNARPSNSGRTAELLGSSIPQFVGFSGLKESGNVLPGFSLPTDEVHSMVDCSNFHLVLKKMNKKDSTTKLKALHEFTELVKSSEVEAVKAVLPLWPKLYCVLTSDTEPRVREATHVAHHQVVLKVKKSLAPLLKQFAGPWFISQYDTYAPAASAAVKSFQDTFPKHKLQEAIVFCQEEILMFICDNLTVQTPESLSTPKMSLQDAEAKYQIIVTSSLLGYTLYLHKVPSESIAAVAELNLNILSNPKFWKLAKSKVVLFKAAWFGVIAAVCQNAPFLLEKEAKRIVETVFGNLDESEPTILTNVWEAVLSILASEIEWQKYVNIQKGVLPKLWKVLKEGGYGSAGTIYPHLLPLLSQLPHVLDNKDLICMFFEKLRFGMKHKLLESRSNLQVASVTFIECLQYLIMKNESDFEFCEKLITSQLFPVLEDGLTNMKVSYKPLGTQITMLVQYWSRNRTTYANYTKFVEIFWCNLDLLFNKILANQGDEQQQQQNEEVLIQLAQNQIQFLLSMKSSVKTKKTRRVSFSGESTTESNEPDKTASTCDEFYSNFVNDFIYKTCKNYVRHTNETQTRSLIEFLVTLVQDFDNVKFFEHLNAELGSEGDSLIDIYDKLLIRWLQNDQLRCKSVVELVFLLLKHLKTEEKVKVLSNFETLNDEGCLSWCIGKCLSHPYNLDPVIQTWVQSECVDSFLSLIMERELNGTCTPELTLILKQAFTEKPSGELFVSNRTISNIIGYLRKCLNDPASYTSVIDKCLSFAAHVSEILYSSTFKLKYGDELLLDLFNLSVTSNLDSDVLSKDTLWEVGTAWEDAMVVLSVSLEDDEFKGLIWKCSDIVKRVLTNQGNVDVIVSVVAKFITCLINNSNPHANNAIIWFFKRDFVSKYMNSLANVCMEAEYMHGHLFNTSETAEEVQNVDFISCYFAWCNIIVSIMVKPITFDEEEEEEDEEEGKEEENNPNIANILSKLEIDDDVNALILQLLYSLTLVTSFDKNYKETMYWREIHTKLQSVNDKVQVLLNSLNENTKNTLETLLTEKVLNENELWCNTLYIYSQLYSHDLKHIYSEVANRIDAEEHSKFLYFTYVFCQHISYDQISKRLDPFESVVVLKILIQCDEIDVQIAETFSRISAIEKNEAELSINWNNFCGSSQKHAQQFIEILRLYAVILRYKPDAIQFNRWDAIIITFLSCLRHLSNNKINFKKLQVKSCYVALTDLFISITEYVENCNKENVKNEWRDVFSQDVHKYLVEIWMYIAGKLEQSTPSDITNVPFLQEFGQVIGHLDYNFLYSKKHKDLQKWTKILKQSCTLLTNKVNSLQVWGYKMLIVLVPILIDVDSASISTTTPHEKGLIFEQFKPLMNHIEEVVQNMFLDFKLGEDSCCVEPFTDSYIYTHAYLLLWDVLLTLCNRSSTELRYQYTDWLKTANLTNNLLDNLFKLIPLNILQHCDTTWKVYTSWFITKFDISPNSSCSSDHIERMVCWTYYMVLSELPSSCRNWWSTKESKTSQIVERVTYRFVSPHLCNKQLVDVAKHEIDFRNMQIKVHANIREVEASYMVDDLQQLALVISLPPNYPLLAPDVQCTKQVATTSLLKVWMNQIKLSLLRQNSTILNCLSLLNNNLDKQFEAADDCNICFAAFHPETCQFAKLACRTCKNKFHPACMYQWFNMYKHSCPICRGFFR